MTDLRIPISPNASSSTTATCAARWFAGAQLRRSLGQAPYPEPVAQLLGELMAAAALLVGTLKFDGLLILQARSEGPIPLLMIECSSERDIRGWRVTRPSRSPRTRPWPT
jgi:redox-regulated HSP33 family molecular chaperone